MKGGRKGERNWSGGCGGKIRTGREKKEGGRWSGRRGRKETGGGERTKCDGRGDEVRKRENPAYDDDRGADEDEEDDVMKKSRRRHPG
uniref:Uncharacterized protein n=1 Tax=Knipowitschia caucasica TaxID=637954 RepID=A0AAV2KWT7_KNICA